MTRTRKMDEDHRFSDWIRERCPDSSTGWICSDVDLVLHHYHNGHVVLLEVKRYMSSIPRGQQSVLSLVDECMRVGMRELHPTWKYHGLWLLQFANTYFDDGLVFLNGKVVSEDALLHALTAFDDPGSPSQK